MSRCLLKVSTIFCGTVAALASNSRDGQIICTPVFSQLNLLLFSKMSPDLVTSVIGVAGSFSGGGQPFRPAKIQSLPVKIFSCQGGPSLPILFCHAKLLCQTVLPIGRYGR